VAVNNLAGMLRIRVGRPRDMDACVYGNWPIRKQKQKYIVRKINRKGFGVLRTKASGSSHRRRPIVYLSLAQEQCHSFFLRFHSRFSPGQKNHDDMFSAAAAFPRDPAQRHITYIYADNV